MVQDEAEDYGIFWTWKTATRLPTENQIIQVNVFAENEFTPRTWELEVTYLEWVAPVVGFHGPCKSIISWGFESYDDAMDWFEMLDGEENLVQGGPWYLGMRQAAVY